MAGHKPHIHLVKGLLGLPFWVCRMPGKIDGGGGDPQSAYRSWLHANSGMQRDQQMAAVRDEAANVAMLAAFIPRMMAAFVVCGLIAAVILWLLWR